MKRIAVTILATLLSVHAMVFVSIGHGQQILLDEKMSPVCKDLMKYMKAGMEVIQNSPDADLPKSITQLHQKWKPKMINYRRTEKLSRETLQSVISYIDEMASYNSRHYQVYHNRKKGLGRAKWSDEAWYDSALQKYSAVCEACKCKKK